MAQQSIPREALVEHTVDCVHFINSLASETAFSIQILVRIGDGASINVKSSFAGIDCSQARVGCALHADSNPRLQNSVSLDDDISFGINHCLIQWMRKSADHAVRCPSGKLGIRVERNYESDSGQNGKLADFYREAIVLFAQEFV